MGNSEDAPLLTTAGWRPPCARPGLAGSLACPSPRTGPRRTRLLRSSHSFSFRGGAGSYRPKTEDALAAGGGAPRRWAREDGEPGGSTLLRPRGAGIISFPGRIHPMRRHTITRLERSQRSRPREGGRGHGTPPPPQSLRGGWRRCRRRARLQAATAHSFSRRPEHVGMATTSQTGEPESPPEGTAVPGTGTLGRSCPCWGPHRFL